MNTGKKNPTDVWSAWIENAKNITQIAALIAAAWWSYITFVKPEFLRPDDYRPHLILETKLESLRVLPDRTVATLGIHVANKSRRFLRTLASHYELRGFNYSSSKQNLDLDKIASTLNENPTTLRPWNLFTRERTQRISIGRILPEQWWFAPEETYSNQIVAVVPCDVNVLQMNLSFRYDHADSEIFRAKWTAKDGPLWYETEIKVDEKYVPHKPGTLEEHKEIEEEHGLQWTVSTTEIDIPRELPIDKCSMTSSNQYGGN